MMENYVYPDTHEMFDLHDTLEELISKESYDIGLGLGSRVDSDPDLEYLLEVLFTPVEARCSYLNIWGSKKYPDIITDIKDGKFMDMSMEEFEEKREKWVKEIRETGLSVSHGEYVHDAVGIGAPVFGIDGKVAASVGIIAPYSRIADDIHLEHMKEQVKHSAAELSYYMGHTFQRPT